MKLIRTLLLISMFATAILIAVLEPRSLVEIFISAGVLSSLVAGYKIVSDKIQQQDIEDLLK